MKMNKIASALVSLALVAGMAVNASASTVERTTNKAGHVIDSFYMMCRVIDINHEANRDVIFVEDNSGNCWSFYDVEIGYWKKGDKMTCVFDYCETCETLELNGVVETDIEK